MHKPKYHEHDNNYGIFFSLFIFLSLFLCLLQAREEWKLVAMVIDRIFLIIYLCAVFIGTLSIVLEAPLAREFFMDVLFRNGTSFNEDPTLMNEACSTYFLTECGEL